MTAKDLIELLQTMNPELPIQIRMHQSEHHKNGEPIKIDNLQTMRTDPIMYSLQPTDVVDTWNGDTGAVAIEFSARI